MAGADPRLDLLRATQATHGPRLYVGIGSGGLAFAPAQQAVLVVGPPRAGKTTGLVVPNVLAAPGAVVSTSTKPDVLVATQHVRERLGQCWLLDPTGSTPTPAGVTAIRWSPVCSSSHWDDALTTARAMVGAARPGGRWGESGHWSERAEALLAPLLHAAAIGRHDMRSVLQWVLRQDTARPAAILAAAAAAVRTGDWAVPTAGPAEVAGARARAGTGAHVGLGTLIAADVLSGIAATDERERSGIWSTAAGVLAAYRSEAALAGTVGPNFDPAALAGTRDTVYICAPAREQALVAPIVVAFVESVRAGTYATAAADALAARATRSSVLLALDEVANIAPLPDLPAIVSEGGGQGLSTLACLQDLSQARTRWGPAADGFLSLFGTKVVLPGIADVATLDLVSRLGGDIDVPTRSVSSGPWWSGARRVPTTTWSTRRQRRLPVDRVSQQPTGRALVLSGNEAPSSVALAPWWTTPPFAPVATPTVDGARAEGAGTRRRRSVGDARRRAGPALER